MPEASLKGHAASKVIADMQKELNSLSRLTNNVRDLDLTDYALAEKHYEAVRERSEMMAEVPES
jgi:hypothetical protein